MVTGSGTSTHLGTEIRKKVLSTASKLNYKPLSTRSPGFVYCAGPVDHTKVDWVSWISPMLRSAHEEAFRHDGISSIFLSSEPQLRSEFHGGKTPQVFRQRKIDGMVITGRLDESMVEHIAESRLPYILMNVSDADAHNVDSVCFDEIFTGMQATRHLLEKGRPVGSSAVKLEHAGGDPRPTGPGRRDAVLHGHSPDPLKSGSNPS